MLDYVGLFAKRQVSETDNQFGKRPKKILKIAIGVAVPAIEAWYFSAERNLMSSEDELETQNSR